MGKQSLIGGDNKPDIQIYIIQPRLTKTRRDGRFRSLVTHGSRGHFGGEEDLAAGDPAFLNGFGTRAFVTVHARGVDLHHIPWLRICSGVMATISSGERGSTDMSVADFE